MFGFSSPAPSSAAAPAPGSFSFTPASAPVSAGTGSFGIGSTFSHTPALTTQPTSFSFGGPAPALSTGFGVSNIGAVAPVPSAPLSVGAIAPAPSTSLSFGSSVPAPSTSLSFGAVAPAPAASSIFGVPIVPGPSTSLSFGAPAAASTTSLSLTRAQEPTGTQVITAQRAPPTEFRNMTVDEIVSKWNENLEEDAERFTEQAAKVAEWDTRMRQNQKSICSLTEQVHKLLRTQDELDVALNAIGSNQSEIDTNLGQLETEVKELCDLYRGRQIDDADIERQKMHTFTLNLNDDLDMMLSSLKEVVTTLNESYARQVDEKGPVAQIVKILNTHQHSLQWLESNAQKLEGDIISLSNQLKYDGSISK